VIAAFHPAHSVVIIAVIQASKLEDFNRGCWPISWPLEKHKLRSKVANIILWKIDKVPK
jgi:hypothetical protein